MAIFKLTANSGRDILEASKPAYQPHIAFVQNIGMRQYRRRRFAILNIII